jgi:feruloyl-CoA synthase
MNVENSPAARMFAEVQITARRRADGTLYISNQLPLAPYPESLVALLRDWAVRQPNAPFLVERNNGSWRHRTYAEVWQRTGEIGARLLGAGCSADRPVMILAPNGIAHAEVALAAMRVGIPAAPVSATYASAAGRFERLQHAAELITPAVLYISQDPIFAHAAQAIRRLVGRVVAESDWGGLDCASTESVATAEAGVGPDTVAKILLTSGSTDKPKGVPNTHRMLCSNQVALAQMWCCLGIRPPVLVDWLPWNHTFGGNFVFNLVLMHGGRLYIDEGKPTPALLGATLANLREIAPTAYFNVPSGYEALLPYLENDSTLAKSFFSRLDFVFSAAAALPQKAHERLQALAYAIRNEPVPVLSGWGSTETAPCSSVVHFPSTAAQNIGLPVPATSIKMVPNLGKLELRVKGPNVMKSYWRQPEATASAFDEEGYYKMGDAGQLIDEANPEAGIIFDGRVSENFKLRSGTWVNVGTLRLTLIDAARPLIQDLVLTCHQEEEIGALIFPNLPACRALVQVGMSDEALLKHPAVLDAIRERIQQHNLRAQTSTRVACFLLQSRPPLADAYEITDKGYINQRAVLRNRAAEVQCLHGSDGCRLPIAGR